jgi:hypothetical protein
MTKYRVYIRNVLSGATSVQRGVYRSKAQAEKAATDINQGCPRHEAWVVAEQEGPSLTGLLWWAIPTAAIWGIAGALIGGPAAGRAMAAGGVVIGGLAGVLTYCLFAVGDDPAEDEATDQNGEERRAA